MYRQSLRHSCRNIWLHFDMVHHSQNHDIIVKTAFIIPSVVDWGCLSASFSVDFSFNTTTRARQSSRLKDYALACFGTSLRRPTEEATHYVGTKIDDANKYLWKIHETFFERIQSVGELVVAGVSTKTVLIQFDESSGSMLFVDSSRGILLRDVLKDCWRARVTKRV